MAYQFNEEDREELMDRGFNNEQLEYLESLEMDTDGLFSDICKIMDDFGDTPEQIIQSYEEANNDNNNPQQYAPQQGGKRRSKKSRTRKSKKSKKSKKTRKSRRSYRRR
jgi:hypothetical protein